MIGDYEMLSDFWRDVIRVRADRRWIVAAAFERDFWLRDGYAWGLVRENLHGRSDVAYRYVNTSDVAEAVPMPGADVIFLGRPKLYAQSVLAPFAMRLAVRGTGKFLDYPNGAPGNSVAYGKHVFTRRDLEAWPWPDHYRRSDQDYAVLQVAAETVAGEPRVLVSFNGVTAFSTLGLVILMANVEQRTRLAREIADLLPWEPGLRPREYLEVCVRVEVAGDAALRDLLNAPRVDFRVEAVVVGGDDRPHLRVDEARLLLTPATGGRGSVVVDGTCEPLALGATRFQLLRWLAEHPEGTRTEELFAPLGIPQPRDDAAKRTAAVRVAKTVHDLNGLFEAFAAFQQRSAIVSKKRRYVLNAQATVAA